MRLSDLEEYRGEDGFIDFDMLFKKVDMSVFNPRKEERGTQSRKKIWLHFDDGDVLLKTIEENTKIIGTCYAELVTAELAKQAGFEVAEVDLAKYNGMEGIISKKVSKENEELHSLREYVGDEEEIEFRAAEDITSFEFVTKNLSKYFKDAQIDREQRGEILQSVLRLLAFDIYVISTDRHTENISFIEKMVDGKKEIVLAPLYDNEFSLMLDFDSKDLENFLGNVRIFKSFVDAASPRIVPRKDFEKNLGDAEWKCLFETILDIDEVGSYAEDLLCDFEIAKAFDIVEKKIKAPIPEIYKRTMHYSFECRERAIEEEIDKFYEKEEIDEDFDEK